MANDEIFTSVNFLRCCAIRSGHADA